MIIPIDKGGKEAIRLMDNSSLQTNHNLQRIDKVVTEALEANILALTELTSLPTG